MAQEQQPKSLPELQAQQASLQRVIEYKTNLYSRIGTGKFRDDKPGIENSLETLRVSDTRKIVADSRTKTQDRLVQISAEIEQFQNQQTESLIELAIKWEDDVRIYRSNNIALRRLADESHLDPEILRRKQEEFNQFRDKPQTDPELKRGLELLAEKRQKEKEEQAQPRKDAKIENAPAIGTKAESADGSHAPIPSGPDNIESKKRKPSNSNMETKEIILPDGIAVEITGETRIKVLENLLSKTRENPELISELTIKIYGEDTTIYRSRVTSAISSINKKRLGWNIINVLTISELRKGQESRYYLEKIQKDEPVEPEPEVIPEIQRFVDEAVVAVTIVVDANGMERPTPRGAEKLIVNPVPPTRAPVPVILMAVPLLAVVVATD